MDGPPWFARLASQRAQVSGYDASHLVSVNTTRTAAFARDGEITSRTGAATAGVFYSAQLLVESFVGIGDRVALRHDSDCQSVHSQKA
jgi:hypothetical protein